jgi:AAA15 family ATPase/GTPase
MELVYLWVQDYKNIHEEGFNFSPRFTCKYENNELTITPKDPEPVSIFPPNINVTAILGENGSGKSSILEIIKLLITMENPGFILWKDAKKFYYFSSIGSISSQMDIIKLHPIFNYLTHSSDIFNTLLWMNQKNKLYECKNPMIFGNFKSFNPNELRMTHISLDMSIYYSYCQNLVLYYFLHKKSKNQIYNPTDYRLFPSGKYFVRKLSDILGYNKNESKKSLEKIKQEMEEYFDNIVNNPKNLQLTNRLYVFLEQLEDNSQVRKINEFYKYIVKGQIPSIKEVENWIYESTHNSSTPILSLLDKLDIKNLNILSDYQELLLKILDNQISKNIFTDVYCFMFYEKSEQNTYKTYDDLSAGEKDFLLLFALIYNDISKNKTLPTLLLLDEIETFFHPTWSRLYLNTLLQEFNRYDIHLILTSHSPFILSDLPKENVIFLQNGQQVNPEIQTFGANIHTLLSHGFFMKDGLMGEFAKEKINKAIEYLNKIKLEPDEIKYCEEIISIIGEPIVKMQLQRMLDSKKLDKMKEIDALKNQIESLKNRLDILVQND